MPTENRLRLPFVAVGSTGVPAMRLMSRQKCAAATTAGGHVLGFCFWEGVEWILGDFFDCFAIVDTYYS